MSDEWVPVSEDLPPLERGRRNVSRNVIVMTAGGGSRDITITAGTAGATMTAVR